MTKTQRAGLAVSGFVLALGQQASAIDVTVVMDGLMNPRGLAVDQFGNLFVAEAGMGGNGVGYTSSNGQFLRIGQTGAVSRLREGVQQRIIYGLPSAANREGLNPGGEAVGVHDIVFDANGDLYGSFGLAADPAVRSGLGMPGMFLGTVSRIPIGGNPIVVADLAQHESDSNPDGQAIDSNPYGIMLDGDRFVAVDAGGNSLVTLDALGNLQTHTVFPNRDNPLPFGPPQFQAVPTTVTVGPDGDYYVGELTGFPFPAGGAQIHRVDPSTGQRSVAYTGFTNIVDMDWGPDGNLYVLQLTTNGLAGTGGPGAGALVQVDFATGAQTTILTDPLFMPGGLIANADGSFYISNNSTSPTGGEVLHVVPEPASMIALGAGALALLSRRRRKA